MSDKEILLNGVMGEFNKLSKDEILDIIKNIYGEMSVNRLDNILSAMIEERYNQK